MDLKICHIQLGVGSCYILKNENCIMIDSGSPGVRSQFDKAIAKVGILPQEIKLIVITHGHWDHIGNARELKEMTGARIAMHSQEKDWLEKGLKPLPPGLSSWGKTMAFLMKLSLPLIHVSPASVDVVIEDDYDLSQYGIPGKIIHTPGHSPGSLSVLLDTGEAFVGDLAMNMAPLRFTPGLPIFGDDIGSIKHSWGKLLERGVKTVYPAHGKPFDVKIIKEALSIL